MEFGVEKLRKVMKPTKYTKKVYIKGYTEGEETTVLTYAFKGQKDSRLTVPNETFKGMKFKTAEEGKIEITDLNGLKILTNDSGWSRLIKEDEEDIDD